MKTKENDFFVDKIIKKYQALSKKEKLLIHLSLGVFLVLSLISQIYNGGKVLGGFLYNITH
jgi:Kef-type K+ transport system membrane component KefB